MARVRPHAMRCRTSGGQAMLTSLAHATPRQREPAGARARVMALASAKAMPRAMAAMGAPMAVSAAIGGMGSMGGVASLTASQTAIPQGPRSSRSWLNRLEDAHLRCLCRRCTSRLASIWFRWRHSGDPCWRQSGKQNQALDAERCQRYITLYYIILAKMDRFILYIVIN